MTDTRVICRERLPFYVKGTPPAPSRRPMSLCVHSDQAVSIEVLVFQLIVNQANYL